MSQLTALKAAKTLSDVADLLDIKPAMLSFNLYVKPAALKYVIFDIPKKNGGVRTIFAPVGDLKTIQRRLSDILHICLQEMEIAQGFSEDTPPHERITHGFKRRRTIMTNAREHL